jgi:hypothetical protein
LFEKPKPEILLIRAMEVSKFETTGTGHSSRLGLIKKHSNPRIMPDREPFLPDANILRRKSSATQYLEFQQTETCTGMIGCFPGPTSAFVTKFDSAMVSQPGIVLNVK